MKCIIPLIVSCSLVYAGKEDIVIRLEDEYESWVSKNGVSEKILNLEKNSSIDRLGPQNLRSFNSAWARTLLANIWGYGCWCYFMEDVGKGHGATKDDIDIQCKVLSEGYYCIKGDDKSCEPWNQSYQSSNGMGLILSMNDPTFDLGYQIRTDCEIQNQNDDCAIKACTVEGYFAMKLLQSLLNSGAPNPQLLHQNGFDPKLECGNPFNIVSEVHGFGGSNNFEPPTDKNQGGQHKDTTSNSSNNNNNNTSKVAFAQTCCGVYPVRFPFDISNGSKACCGQVTYAVTSMDCCIDDVTGIETVEAIGNCQ